MTLSVEHQSVSSAGDQFADIFAAIADGAVEREQSRRLAFDAVDLLRKAKFGALRVPRKFGGAGLSLVETFEQLIRLAEADSNLPQIIRAHFGFVENRLHRREEGEKAPWFNLVADGVVFGAAMAELDDKTGTNTSLRRVESGWILNGTKYYSTGTIYADWIAAIASDDDNRYHVAVPTSAPGVERLDDWNGFGQRLTGSGTTHFRDVRVADHQILNVISAENPPGNAYLTAYYQLFHLATFSGIARAIVRDAREFVLPRTRTFGVPGKVSQKDDPLVQRVIGRLSALSFSINALTRRVSEALASASVHWEQGIEDHPSYANAEIEAFQAQQIIVGQILEAATLLFEVGGASATSEARRLDRHWRNARVLASHNPAIQRERELGDLVLNATPLGSAWRAGASRRPAEHHVKANVA